jgi:hypothetical protein
MLREGRLHPQGRRADQDPGDFRHLQAQVSEMARSLDEAAEAVLNGPLEAGSKLFQRGAGQVSGRHGPWVR